MDDFKDIYIFWGKNSEGQLPKAPLKGELHMTPQILESPFRVKKVVCGEDHAISISTDGVAYSVGNNDCGQLGRQGLPHCFSRISTLETKNIIDASCGSKHTLLLDSDGNVYGFGDNRAAQLSLHPSIEAVAVPKRIVHSLQNVVYIACAFYCSFAVTNLGVVYAWGCNSFGELGISDEFPFCSNAQEVVGLRGLTVTKIVGGFSHVVSLTSNGYLYAWGNNAKGQVGCSDEGKTVISPQLVKYLERIMIIDVECGKDHTVALTSDGRIFSFGYGQMGQLGHGSSSVEYNPRQVLDLAGVPISLIACGNEHTLVYSQQSATLYAFGNSDFFQCGEMTKLDCYKYPKKVYLLSSDSDYSAYSVRSLATGGDYNIILYSFPEVVLPERSSSDPLPISRYSDTNATVIHQDILTFHNFNAAHRLAISQELIRIFSSSTCLNSSFIRRDKPRWHSDRHNINFDMVREFYSFYYHTRDMTLLLNQLTEIVHSMHDVVPHSTEMFRFIYVLLASPADFGVGRPHLTIDIAISIFRWGEASLLLTPFTFLPHSVFQNFLNKLKHDFLLAFVNDIPARAYLLHVGKLDYIHNFCSMFQTLYEFNKCHNLIDYTCFYLQGVEDVFKVTDEYIQKLISPDLHELYDHAYLLDPKVKSWFIVCRLLLSNIKQYFRRYPTTTFTTRLLTYFYSQIPPSGMLVIRVRRSAILEDTFVSLLRKYPSEFKSAIYVEFLGEEAIDQGGVRKEFFLLITKDIFEGNYGLFMLHSDSQLFWFPQCHHLHPDYYFIFGLLVSLAIYNSIILDLHFPLALYQKLLGDKPDFESFAEFEPVIAKSFRHMLSNEEADFEEVYPLTFEIELSMFDEVVKRELIPGGKDVAVTQSNKQKYVDAYIEFVFNTSSESFYDSFSRGFYTADVAYFKKLLNPYELREIIIGCQDYDFSSLENATVYKGYYNASHPTIRMFWEVFHSMSLDLKKKFLKFLTGSDKLPIQGISTLGVSIQPMNSSTQALPVAHTCSNILDLPPYENINLLEEKLKKAIEYCEGFGLI